MATENTLIVINEQHELMADQVRALNEKFGGGNWVRFNVPADGWSAEEQVKQLEQVENATLVFASPLPLMLRDATRRVNGETYVFHNDRRDKKEIPQKDGSMKVIFTVAATGWVIL